MSRRHLLGIAVVVLTTAFFSESRADDKQPPPAKAVNAAAAALIDKLANVAEADTGYSPFVSGSSFAPLAGSDRVAVMVLFQRPSARSDTFRELVKLGAAAVPDLVAHLNDKRPTRINVGGFGQLFINEKDKDDKPGVYILKVGDLCYVALGQIVNRSYAAVWYQPSALVFVHTPTRDAKMRDELKKEWGELTPDKHRKSLLKDCEGKGEVPTRIGAFIRVGWYYPDALEAPALQFLALSAYDLGDSWDCLHELYRENDAHKRRELFDAYVKKRGEAGRDGLREVLFSDLRTLEADEEKRLSPPGVDFGDKPRKLLIELYAAPKTVKAKDKPVSESFSTNHVVEVIKYGLTYDRSVKIDRAVRDVLVKTTDDDVALACMKRLVGRGFDAEIEAYYHRREKDLKERDKAPYKEFLQKTGWSPLHVAVWSGQPERMTELLREGAKVNAAAKDGRTPLHVAAVEGDAQIIKFLLDAGADQKATDKQGRTPVSVASFEGNTETVRQLVAASGPISDIFVAATVGKTEEVAAFLRQDKEMLRAKDRAGLTPLHRATAEGHLKIMQLLLDAGAEVDSQNAEGWTPLRVAAVYGRTDACALLLQRKAKVEGTSDTQPIHFAAMQGHLDVVKLLVEKGANVDARDGMKRTPLHFAAGDGHLAVVKWLVEHKADINAKDKEGKNVYYYATVNKDTENEVAEYLLKNGAKDE